MSKKKELERLLERGLEFTITINKSRKKHLFAKREYFKEKQTFKIPELTLATIDRIDLAGINLYTDVKTLDDTKIIRKQTKDMARIVALAVLGEDYEFKTSKGYIRNEPKLEELTNIFMKCLKPSELIRICNFINIMSNMADFTNSIRLMASVSEAERIECEQLGGVPLMDAGPQL